MKINNKKIGINHPTYFIAEIGSNFDGKITRAKDLIKLAAENNADAVKFQHYTAETLVSERGFKDLKDNVKTHQSKWEQSVSETYDKASLNKEWTEELSETAHENELSFITSPYSLDLVDYVEPYVDAYKIGSGDITFNEILKKIAKKNMPTILASGAAKMKEVKNAVKILTKENTDLCLMQCNTNYEGKLESSKYQNLSVLNSFKKNFPHITLGLSCHLPNSLSVLASIVFGSRVIEKHFTDDRERVGPDHGFAIMPKEWKKMIEDVRLIESMMGDGKKVVEKNEEMTVIVQQRCIRAKRKINKGERVKKELINFLRPCPKNAIKPYDLNLIIGKELIKEVEEGEHITLDHII